MHSPTNEKATKNSQKPWFHFWRCFWLIFLLGSLGYAWYCFYVPPNEIAWAKDYDSAREQSVESGKPIVLYFTATWCVPCRIMKRQVWADEQVRKKVNSGFIPVAIDIGSPENTDLMTAYKVSGAPVTIVCDSQGNALNWRAGGTTKADFLKLLDEKK